MNVVVLRGRLSRPARQRQLDSGTRLVNYELTVVNDEGPVDTVPVVWIDAPGRASEYAEGTELVVVGRVRRRFFKAGGSTQSRTEVVAVRVVPARHAKKATAAIAAAGEGLIDAAAS